MSSYVLIINLYWETFIHLMLPPRKWALREMAKKLHLTQGAVSHRIKVLEGELDLTCLYEDRKLELTEEGQIFQRTLSKSLSSIFGEIEDITNTDLYGQINIGTSPAFANSWFLLFKASWFQTAIPKVQPQYFSLKKSKTFIKIISASPFTMVLKIRAMHRQRLFQKSIFRYVRRAAAEHDIFDDGLESLHRINSGSSAFSLMWRRGWSVNQPDKSVWAVFIVWVIDMCAECSHNIGVAMGRYHFVASTLRPVSS